MHSTKCPHCAAGEPSVWDGVLDHFAHPHSNNNKLKFCHEPWRDRCRRCSADIGTCDCNKKAVSEIPYVRARPVSGGSVGDRRKTTLAAKLRKLATDCRSCRYGHCCGQCLCCMPEEKLRAIVQEAREDVKVTTKTRTPAVEHTVTPRIENDGYRGHCTCGWISDWCPQLEATGRAAASHLRQVHTAQVSP